MADASGEIALIVSAGRDAASSGPRDWFAHSNHARTPG
jgi:hypothetical protein